MIAVKDLRPADPTAGAIRSALARIRDERKAAETEIAAATEARTKALITGTTAEIAKVEDLARKFRIHAEQLDTLEDYYRPLLDDAILVEELAAYDRARDVFDEKCAALGKFVSGRYLEIVAELKEFFAQENEVVADAVRLSGMRAAQRGKRPGMVSSIAASMPKAYVRPDVPGLPFGFAIKLPSIAQGLPLWRQERSPVVPPNLEKYR